MKKLPDFETRGRYQKDDFNRLKNEVRRLGNITVQFPLEINNIGAGPLLRFVDREFWAVLTACSSSSSCGFQPPCPYGPAYCWAEVQPDGSGGFSIDGAGRTSGSIDPTTGLPINPAYEANNACLLPGTIVRLRPGFQDEYLIDHCCTFIPPFISCSSSSSSSSQGSAPSSVASSATSTGSSTGSTTSSSGSTGSTTSSSGGNLCVPFVSMVTCGGSSGGSSAGGGTLVVTLKYLNIPASLGITVSDTPCAGSSG